MRRVHVIGTSGSGKTALARRAARILGVRHVELDAVFHQPEWTPLPDEGFRAAVEEIVAGDAWVIDGNYRAVRDIIWGRADTVVWIDLARPIVMRRIVARTLRRVATGQELWNTNRERWRNVFSRRPEENIILWAWTTHRERRVEYDELMSASEHIAASWVRLRTPADVERWVASLE